MNAGKREDILGRVREALRVPSPSFFWPPKI